MLRRNRSVEAIEGLFDDHFGEIHRFAVCRVGREAAADIAAETFEQALRSADRLDPERDARAWLFGIARNVAFERRRLGPTLAHDDEGGAQIEAVIPSPNPETALLDRETARAFEVSTDSEGAALYRMLATLADVLVDGAERVRHLSEVRELAEASE